MSQEPIPKGRILCTEDDADTCEAFNLILRSEGFEVVCTNNPEDAIKLARTESFDLLLVDNWMPGMSGSQLTERLREFNVNTPILFCSGSDEQEDKDEARLAGAQGYLVKPVGMDDLIAEIVRLIKEARVA